MFAYSSAKIMLYGLTAVSKKSSWSHEACWASTALPAPSKQNSDAS